MDIFRIDGPVKLDGVINVSGSKNAALPIMASALLARGNSIIKDVPKLADIAVLEMLLSSLGAKVHRDQNDDIHIDATTIDNPVGEYDIVRKMRASICILGPLVARCGRAEVSMPGGCAIGDRPVDIHLRGLTELGANIHLENGNIVATAPNGLTGKSIFLGGPFGSTVLGTANILMASTLAKGTTVIESAACEPEITDLANFLNKMGARITGMGSPRLTIEGVDQLKPVEHRVIGDRIEAGTFMVAAAITAGKLEIKNCSLNDMVAVVDRLEKIGVRIDPTEDGCIVTRSGRLIPADVTTQTYPGFPTDLQAQLMALLALADGNSIITEKIFPDRFMHVAEMNRMAANIRKEGPIAIVAGVDRFVAAPIMASDLRASAALVLAAMAAHGRTTISRVYHIDRGYEKIEEKLNAVGAKIIRESV
ncbi:MAG: UDP-N-acetylglucosamine 1-carboxyvinyltransferase [Anaerohalosphaera sp.]|nr:UDP-N-acetylglucosamine 1-carboxyvinyltransferase [Anaerohalosphaera sp.]